MYDKLIAELPSSISLVAVSKKRSCEQIMALYQQGQRLLGENRVDELCEKYEALPEDIEWHFIGHLQTKKVKKIASFVSLIHSVDTPKLLSEINKQAERNERIIPCLLQVHIAQEETKYGFSSDEILPFLSQINHSELSHVQIVGMMGMATRTEDTMQIEKEFSLLHSLFEQAKSELQLSHFSTLSMGMSNDYPIAIRAGANMVRIGSLLW